MVLLCSEKLKKHPIKTAAFFFLCALLVICIATKLVRAPSNDRDWSLDQVLLPYAEFNGDTVTIRNIRNFIYTDTETYTPQYYDKTFNLSELSSVDFIVEPLAPIAVAHTFVTFGFTGGEYVAISVEIRKEKGESFSPLLGLLDSYELMYVIVDERDTISLRAVHRDNPVYLYPAQVPKEKMQALFVSMLERANMLRERPEFYNTITSTCTTNIVDHINAITPGRVQWDIRLILPLDADELAYELGLIDTSVPLELLRERHNITPAVKQFSGDPHFSTKIREAIAQ